MYPSSNGTESSKDICNLIGFTVSSFANSKGLNSVLTTLIKLSSSNIACFSASVNSLWGG